MSSDGQWKALYGDYFTTGAPLTVGGLWKMSQAMCAPLGGVLCEAPVPDVFALPPVAAQAPGVVAERIRREWGL